MPRCVWEMESFACNSLAWAGQFAHGDMVVGLELACALPVWNRGRARQCHSVDIGQENCFGKPSKITLKEMCLLSINAVGGMYQDG